MASRSVLLAYFFRDVRKLVSSKQILGVYHKKNEYNLVPYLASFALADTSSKQPEAPLARHCRRFVVDGNGAYILKF
jgi:hypothetical protein